MWKLHYLHFSRTILDFNGPNLVIFFLTYHFRHLKKLDKMRREFDCRECLVLHSPLVCTYTCYKAKTNYSTLPEPNIVEVLGKLAAPSTRSIKDQGKVVVENVEKLGYYADVCRKVLTVLSIFMVK